MGKDSNSWTHISPARNSPERGGEPVIGTGHEELCAAGIAAIVDGQDAASRFCDPLIVAPGFAHAMTGQTKFPFGTPTPIHGPSGGGEYFFLAYRVADEDLVAMTKAKTLRAFLRRFTGRKAVPATREQRSLYYALIPFEIAGYPVSVIQDGSACLLLQANTNDKILWLDMIDQYPLPSVARSMREVIEVAKKLKREKN